MNSNFYSPIPCPITYALAWEKARRLLRDGLACQDIVDSCIGLAR